MDKCRCNERPSPRVRWTPRPDGMEESVQFELGYNCPRRDPGQHGVHGMGISWYLRGPAGGAQFRVYTNWIPGLLSPGHGLPPLGMSFPRRDYEHYPVGSDVGYHARRPQYEGQEPIHDNCPIIGGPCYYDGSGMRAERLAHRFIEEGEEVIWAELESVYAGLLAEDREAERVAEQG